MKTLLTRRVTTLALLTAIVSASAFGSNLVTKAESVNASSHVIQAKAVPSSRLLTPTNHTLLM
ncbi:hypothetical protein, partial [Paenibacillus sp. LPE1-1-1.1]|uniref:hypothetical protein n=1 Tax=Paenibacillus sp. LPE1-1-1.1 TaxID=3135230 RepID=UPI003448F3D4